VEKREKGKMMSQLIFKQKGITLIELLIALVIFGTVIGGIYRLFVAQSKAYTVQDQVVEVQQGIRSVMEILLRDLRMTGFDDDSLNSKITIPTPLVVGDHSITVSYEYDNTHQYTVDYRVDGNARLIRTLTIIPDVGLVTATSESILDNVNALDFTYGVDTNDDGALDTWVPAGGIGIAKVVAVRVNLTARPDQTNQDVKNLVSPRTLNSIVTLRNLCLAK
jgi:prepilin-type N-terminal cleavage/methylation domain-containing protein